uniref:G_PROTEIN_RECEP_F1_2 domain-containing protein n=1 Tax=Panagrellus redivivus TaxID=6233 RepID=A0A7E4ZTK9_PANRE
MTFIHTLLVLYLNVIDTRCTLEPQCLFTLDMSNLTMILDLDTTTLIYAGAELLLAVEISLSNLLVLWVYARSSHVRTPTNAFIFSLALVDFLAGAVGIPVTVFSVLTTAPHSFLACLSVHLILCVLCTISIFHLLAIAIDKYITICCKCQLLYQRTRHGRAMVLIVMAWVFGTAIAIMPLFDAFGFYTSGKQKFQYQCQFLVVVDYHYLLYVIFFATIIIPSLIIVFCYASIYSRIRYEEKQIKCLLRASERQRRINNRRKLIRILLILVITYAVCWYPLYLVNTVDFYFPQYRSTKEMVLATVVLSHFGCAINPIIYAYGMPGFKHALRAFFRIGGTISTGQMSYNRASTIGNCSCLMKQSVTSTHTDRKRAVRAQSYVPPIRKKSHVRFEAPRKISEPPTMITSGGEINMSPVRVSVVNGCEGFERIEYEC